MTAIFKKELRTYYNSMMGYVFLTLLVVMIAVYFAFTGVFGMNTNYGQVLASFWVIITTLLMVSVLTMRLFAEEARQRTDQLLYTAPVTTAQIVLGKYFAACCMLLAGTLISGINPLMVSSYGIIPWGSVLTAHVGFFLMGCAFISVGMFISSLTDNQIIAAAGSFVALFLMYLMDGLSSGLPASRSASVAFTVMLAFGLAALIWFSTKNAVMAAGGAVLGVAVIIACYAINAMWFDGLMINMFRWFSISSRFESFSRGIFDMSNIVYYLTFSAAFVYLTINRLEKRRWN
ncbi:MAG: ABC transporter permease subunit [Oscillospiraceae bacterium]|nr:ABC transporter permease subunit [Oscillospiraceae bacterium]